MPRMKKGSSGVIGIDLGTRNAQCACLDADGRPVLIPNRWGRTNTPSIVGRDDSGWLVGEDALRASLQGLQYVWWDLKRKVGTDFKAVCGKKRYSPQELIVPLIAALREDAEAFLENFVSSCVLAVPACFSVAQRKAMVQAGLDAGLQEVGIVNEPTAAALSFGETGRFLILDFGAGTVDISVVESEQGMLHVLESLGSSGIGGHDFDQALAEYLRERLLLPPLSLEDPRWRMLLAEAENIKIALSSAVSHVWTPPAFGTQDGSPPIVVEREELERVIRFPIRRLVHTVRRLWEKHEPDRLLLVGGSSRIPLLSGILEREVARPTSIHLCPYESVALGAALHTRAGEEHLLIDALSGDIGILEDDRPRKVIASGTPLPTRAETTLTALRPGILEIPVFQNVGDFGERQIILSVLKIEADKGEELSLTFRLDSSGHLEVEVLRAGGEKTTLSPLDIHRNSFHEPRESWLFAQKLDRLKLRLTPLEVSMTPEQQENLHLLVGQIESLQGDAQALNVLEGLVRELEVELS